MTWYAYLPYQFERAAEERLEGRLGARSLCLAHGGFRGGPRAAQVEQRREHILIDRIERGGCRAPWLVAGRSGQLVPQLADTPPGRLLSARPHPTHLLHFPPPTPNNPVPSR